MSKKVLNIENMKFIECVECGGDCLRGIWNGPEEYIDLECYKCGAVMTDNKTRDGIFELNYK